MKPKVVNPKIVHSKIDERKFRQVNRRKLLKLTPVITLGAFAIPGLREPLLKKGLGLSDWASAQLFRTGHPATTFADSDLGAGTDVKGFEFTGDYRVHKNLSLTASYFNFLGAPHRSTRVTRTFLGMILDF